MGVVRLVENGFIFKDEFNVPTLADEWELLPNDPSRYTIDGGALQLEHGDTPLYLFLEQLSTTEQFVMDVKNNYNPVVDGDVGGLIVYADNDNVIELEEYFDVVEGTTNSYPWLRLIRNYQSYSAYWSEDGVLWNFIGSWEFDRTTPKIGFYLRGNPEGAVPMIVEEVRVFRRNKVTVDNLEAGVKVELHDEVGTVIDTKICRAEQSTVSFDMAGLPFPFKGNFAVTINDGNKFQIARAMDIHGGDLYKFEVMLDVYYVEFNEQGEPYELELYPNMERFLGYLKAGSSSIQNIKMIARNPFTSGTFYDVLYELVAHETEHYKTMVKIAPDVDGIPGTGSSNIMAFEVAPGGEFVFWIIMERASQSEGDRYSSQIKFGMRVSSEYL